MFRRKPLNSCLVVFVMNGIAWGFFLIKNPVSVTFYLIEIHDFLHQLQLSDNSQWLSGREAVIVPTSRMYTTFNKYNIQFNSTVA